MYGKLSLARGTYLRQELTQNGLHFGSIRDFVVDGPRSCPHFESIAERIEVV